MTESETAIIATAIASALQTETVAKAYDDLRSVVQQLSSIGATVLKIAGSPIKVAALHADRWVRLVERATARVPEEARQEPAPSMTGAIFDATKYLESGNPLLDLYEQLLASAMDKTRVEIAHPAFVELIKQLSADESFFLYRISKETLVRVEVYDSYPFQAPEVRNNRVEACAMRAGELLFPQNEGMYIGHLLSLNLIGMSPVSSYEDTATCSVVTVRSTLLLSSFGELFARACIPTKWDLPTVTKSVSG